MKADQTARTVLAHVRCDQRGTWVEHALETHLREVGELAAQFALPCGASDWARLSGLWHDLGKYSTEFQRYIKSASGYDAEAHIEGIPGRVNHSTAGAIHAVDRLKGAGRIIAYLIAGHHAGLPDWAGDENAAASLSHRLNQRQHLEVLPLGNIPKDVLHPEIQPLGKIPGGADGAHLWLRILFSCLVDADFLDTEAFMNPEKADGRSGFEALGSLRERFDKYMTTHFGKESLTSVNRVRADVLRQCREKARLTPGLFSLTVPTGGGKTLASLAFALEHARHHGKRRVVYAIPYTSIIEQTAGIYREIFGDNVIEHHSSLDPDRETSRSRLAAENWDAPIIVTTNVQLFESLFAAKPSRCRKLHNLINSVIILDEAQLLPPELLQPVLDVLNLLAKHYGVTAVLCTATQPALEQVKTFGRELRGLTDVREIMDDPDGFFVALKRVEVRLPANFHVRGDWDNLAAEISGYQRILAVVNSRSDCRELWRRMPKGAIHLSGAMCGAHRSQVIAGIKSRLSSGEEVRVVSTQLVEAGVDLDFPLVYRALAGLDSIAQAAGRCNREGKLDTGYVTVFVPPRSAPPGQLRRAEQATVSLLSGTSIDPMARPTFTRYFERFYLDAPSWDAKEIIGLLARDASRMEIQFRTAAERFRFIDDTDSQPILVRWGNESTGLIGKLEKDGPERWLMRKLQRYTVNLPRRQVEKLIQTGDLREVCPGIFAQNGDTLYHPALGVVPDTSPDIEQLVVSEKGGRI